MCVDAGFWGRKIYGIHFSGGTGSSMDVDFYNYRVYRSGVCARGKMVGD